MHPAAAKAAAIAAIPLARFNPFTNLSLTSVMFIPHSPFAFTV
jgi:hypothetical protein